MLNNLLELNFIAHYRLTTTGTVNVVSTTKTNFDLNDDAVLVYPTGKGIAKYSNPNNKEVNIVNFESFINSLPRTFQHRREKCDLILCTSDYSYFILSELTNTDPKYVSDFARSDGTFGIGKRSKAISQLKQTLKDISDVSEIDNFIKRHSTKHCCFFNKQSLSPIGISAIIAFSRLSSITPNGFKMSNPEIESFGFELWEFSGSQTYLLSRVKPLAEQLSKLTTKEVKELADIIQSENKKSQKKQ